MDSRAPGLLLEWLTKQKPRPTTVNRKQYPAPVLEFGIPEDGLTPILLREQHRGEWARTQPAPPLLRGTMDSINAMAEYSFNTATVFFLYNGFDNHIPPIKLKGDTCYLHLGTNRTHATTDPKGEPITSSTVAHGELKCTTGRHVFSVPKVRTLA